MNQPAVTRTVLRDLPVFAGDLPPFDPDAAATRPDQQFLAWLAEAAGAGVREPHAMTLSTISADGRPDARTLILKNVDESGWQFAGIKGAIDAAALTFYWPQQGRQIRVRGPVVAAGAAESAADFRARSPRSQAVARTGRSGQTLASRAELLAEVAKDEDLQKPTGWTLYVLAAEQVEFFQGDPDRLHIRLCYTRVGAGWHRRLRWP